MRLFVMLRRLYDFLTGHCVRKISQDSEEVFLTFDDGPHEEITEKVLDLMREKDVKATFFIIGKNGQQYPRILKRILDEGHGVADHSIDHDTKNYFTHYKKIREWVEDSQKKFTELTGRESIGFRSPLGIKTPPLMKALKDLNIPLILWDIRYYDTKYVLTTERVDSTLRNIEKGSIILLHDNHQRDVTTFLNSLGYLIDEVKKKNFSFGVLNKKMIEESI